MHNKSVNFELTVSWRQFSALDRFNQGGLLKEDLPCIVKFWKVEKTFTAKEGSFA